MHVVYTGPGIRLIFSRHGHWPSDSDHVVHCLLKRHCTMVRNQPGNFDMLPFVPISIPVLFCYGNVQLVTFNCARMRAYARALTKIKTFAEFLPRKRPSAPRARRRCFYTKRSLVLLPRARSITTSIRLIQIARIYLLIFNFYFFL